MKCWYCEKETDIKETAYGDHRCPACGVEISVYPPQNKSLEENNPATTEDEWLNEESEEEMIDYNDAKYQGKFVYLPLMGQTAVFDIAEINEVKSDNPKFNFSENVPVMLNGEQVIDDEGEPCFKRKDLGYHIECRLVNGKILSITSMSAFIQVFKKNNIQDGETWRVFHKDKGEWVVEKL